MWTKAEVIQSSSVVPISAQSCCFITTTPQRNKKDLVAQILEEPRKLRRLSIPKQCAGNVFDSLPEDLLLTIIGSLISTASSPKDLACAMLTCRRFCAAASHPQVTALASTGALAVPARNWCDGANRFLKLCADAGNAEASYTLGMIRYYCLFNRNGGAALMARAAMQHHAAALHSLAVIQFNGSGGTRKDKDLKAGVAFCIRAACLGHVDAMRELGHCLQDGYGVVRNFIEGRRLLLEANAREAAAAVAASGGSLLDSALQIVGPGGVVGAHDRQSTSVAGGGSSERSQPEQARVLGRELLERQYMFKIFQSGDGCPLLSEFGCAVPHPRLHIANKFLVDWFHINPPASGLRLCSHGNCGRPETRRHEFRRCSACGCVNYCSRACQALDWKIRHKYDCQPVADWGERQDENEADDDEQLAYEDGDDS